VPADDGLSLHDDENVSPAGPTRRRAPRPVGGGRGFPARYHSDCERKRGALKGKRG
jgi:hypothetical protein